MRTTYKLNGERISKTNLMAKISPGLVSSMTRDTFFAAKKENVANIQKDIFLSGHGTITVTIKM